MIITRVQGAGLYMPSFNCVDDRRKITEIGGRELAM